MINRMRFSIFLLLIFLSHCIDAQNNIIIDCKDSISTHSYSIHFKHLATGEGDSRKVTEGLYQEAGHEKAREYITVKLQEYCGKYNVYNEDFSWSNFKNLSNIIGIQYGYDPIEKGIWVIGAHYDSNNNRGKGLKNVKPGAPGANDNASGISAMLEIARVLKNYNLGPTIIFAAWDLEERFFKGMAIGSSYWIKNHLQEGIRTDHDNLQERTKINIADIKTNINIDMIGRINNKALIKPEMWVYSGLKKDEMFAQQYTHEIDSITNTIKAVYKGSISYSDHYSFASIGIPSVENAEADLFNDKFYHTYADNIDNPDNLSYSYAAQISQLILNYILVQNPPKTETALHYSNYSQTDDSIFFDAKIGDEKIMVYDSLGTKKTVSLKSSVLPVYETRKSFIRIKTNKQLLQLVP